MDIKGPKAWLNEPVYKLEGDALSAAVAEEIMGWKRVTWKEGTFMTFMGGINEVEEDVTFLVPPSWNAKRYHPRDITMVMDVAVYRLPSYATRMDALDEVIDSLLVPGSIFQFQRRLGGRGWFVDITTDRRGGTFAISGQTRPEALARAMLEHVRQHAE